MVLSGGSIPPVRTVHNRVNESIQRMGSIVWAVLALMVMVGFPALVAVAGAIDYVVTARRYGTRAQRAKSMRRRTARAALAARG